MLSPGARGHLVAGPVRTQASASTRGRGTSPRQHILLQVAWLRVRVSADGNSVRPVASAGKTGRLEDTCWPDSGVIRGLVPLSCPGGGASCCPGPQLGLWVQHLCVARCVWLGLPSTMAASGTPCFLYGGSVLQTLGSRLTREKLHGL